MDGSIMDFLRWFFGMRQVDADDITVVLADAGHGDASVAEVQEALDLLVDDLDEDGRQLAAQSRAQLEAATADTMASGALTFSSLTVTDLAAQIGQIPTLPPDVVELAPGLEVTVNPPTAPLIEPAQSEAAPTEAVAPVEASETASAPAPAQDAGQDVTPPSTHGQPATEQGHPPPDPHEAPTENGPPPDPHQAPTENGPPPDPQEPPTDNGPPPDPQEPPTENGLPPTDQGLPETWAGQEVQTNGAGPYVVFSGGAAVYLVPTGAGTYVGVYHDFRLGETPDGGVMWTNTPTGGPYLVDGFGADGIILAHPNGGSIELSGANGTYRMPADATGAENAISFADPFTFYQLTETGVVINHTDGYQLVLDPEGESYQDPATGDRYDSLQELLAAQDDASNGVDPEPDPDPTEGTVEPVYPDSWAGYEVQVDDSGAAYIELGAENVYFETDLQGGLYVEVLDGYVLVESAGGALVWGDTPTGAQYLVSDVTNTKVIVSHPDGGTVEFGDGPVRYRGPPAEDGGTQNLSGGDPFSFYEITDTGIALAHPDGYQLYWSPNSVEYRDPETGEFFESLAQLQAAQGDLVNNGNIGDIDTIDPIGGTANYPDSWGEYSVDADAGGPYVEIDGQKVYLALGGSGFYQAIHGEFLLVESPQGGVLWSNTPTGAHYAVTGVTESGVTLAHASGGAVEVSNGAVKYDFPDSGDGGGSSSLQFGDEFAFYELTPTGVAVSHDDGYQLYWAPDGIEYRDPETGESFESLQDLQIAQGGDTENGTSDNGSSDNGNTENGSSDNGTPDNGNTENGAPDNGTPDNGLSDTIDAGDLTADNRNGNGNGSSVETGDNGTELNTAANEGDLAPPPPPPPDSVGIQYGSGQPELFIMHSGVAHEVPLVTHSGGLFITIGGQELEVHTQGSTYFVVANGQAYDLAGDPTASGWPYDHPAPGIDTSIYDSAPVDEGPVTKPVPDETTELAADDDEDGSEPAEPVPDDEANGADVIDLSDVFDNPIPTEPAPLEDTLPPEDDGGEAMVDELEPIDDDPADNA